MVAKPYRKSELAEKLAAALGAWTPLEFGPRPS
jgi:hypothetical protein